MTDVAESRAPFPLQLHHAHLQLHLLPLPLSLTDTDSATVLDAHVFSPLHEFGASCPLPGIRAERAANFIQTENSFTDLFFFTRTPRIAYRDARVRSARGQGTRQCPGTFVSSVQRSARNYPPLPPPAEALAAEYRKSALRLYQRGQTGVRARAHARSYFIFRRPNRKIPP